MYLFRNIDIMGIINLTDDSFFSDSRYLDSGVEEVVAKVGQMLKEGATIVDFGACSTRPGAELVSEEEEWRRLEQPLKAVRTAFPSLRISVDTFRSAIVRKVYGLVGDFIVNDISAGEDDNMMLSTVGELGLTYVAMHKRGVPQTMQQMCDYEDVVEEVVKYFREFSAKAEKNSIKNWIIDPGFGFAKTIEQNYQLLDGLSCLTEIKKEGEPSRVLVGVSRKSMIYKLLDVTPEESLSATQVVHLLALQGGASILRVHDVAEAVRTVRIYRYFNSLKIGKFLSTLPS